MAPRPAESAQHSMIDKALAEIVPKIEKIIDECEEMFASQMQPAVDKIVNMSLETNMATRKNVRSRNCGIHPSNRGGTGVDAINAQDLTLKITKQGYSETKLENPMGFEKALEGSAAASAQQKFMKHNFKSSADLLKPIEWEDTDYLPVTCSHTMAAANIVEAGKACLGLHPELSTEGRIDTAKILQLCPAWKKALSDGIPCIVFRRELDAACPRLAEFLSKAGNQSHDVHSKETKPQIMLSMHQLMTAKQKLPGSTAASVKEKVVKEISTMKPDFEDFAKEAYDFVHKYGGGDDAQSLYEIEIYCKALAERKEPADGQVGLLATAQLRQAPQWPIAMLKALVQAPEKIVRRKGRLPCTLLKISRRLIS